MKNEILSIRKMDATIFWFDNPPKVEKGAFNAFSKIWEGEVLYVLSHDFRQERKAANWDDGDYGNAQVVALYEMADRQAAINNLFEKYPDAIHIANGFDTPIMKEIKPFFFKKGRKALLFTERPVSVGSWAMRLIKRTALGIKYTLLCHEYKPYIRAILPLGMQGVKIFRQCGFPKDRIYNFMYCPQLEDLSDNRDFNVGSPIRFLYVGRFYYLTKGTDVLMDALKYLKGDWVLDMAGGYGTNAEEVKRRIEANSHVNYLGVWDSTKVVKSMQNYDVVVVPSKADGWNLLINEALHSGISIITSDEAVSHEVIEKCHAGMIFKAYNSKALANCMQYAIDNPKDVAKWMKNGRGMAKVIGCDRIGVYFKDIIDYEFYNKGQKPICPWL